MQAGLDHLLHLLGGVGPLTSSRGSARGQRKTLADTALAVLVGDVLQELAEAGGRSPGRTPWRTGGTDLKLGAAASKSRWRDRARSGRRRPRYPCRPTAPSSIMPLSGQYGLAVADDEPAKIGPVRQVPFASAAFSRSSGGGLLARLAASSDSSSQPPQAADFRPLLLAQFPALILAVRRIRPDSFCSRLPGPSPGLHGRELHRRPARLCRRGETWLRPVPLPPTRLPFNISACSPNSDAPEQVTQSRPGGVDAHGVLPVGASMTRSGRSAEGNAALNSVCSLPAGCPSARNAGTSLGPMPALTQRQHGLAPGVVDVREVGLDLLRDQQAVQLARPARPGHTAARTGWAASSRGAAWPWRESAGRS